MAVNAAPPAPVPDLEWVRKKHQKHLTETVYLHHRLRKPTGYLPPTGALDNWPKSHRVSLAEMQRMRIQRLQYKLSIHAKRLSEGPVEDWDEWEKDLQSYVQAIQEHDYMERKGGESRDPFLITGERKNDRELLQKVMGNTYPATRREIPLLKWETKRTSPVGTRGDNRSEKLFTRIGVAAVGAAFLIAPMWLCILVLDTLQALWTTTIFVAVFGLMMAFVLHDNIAVLSATAAYAAVLVVFVALVAEENSN